MKYSKNNDIGTHHKYLFFSHNNNSLLFIKLSPKENARIWFNWQCCQKQYHVRRQKEEP